MTTRSENKRRRLSRPYPAHTLEDSLEVAQAVYGRGGSVNRVVLAGSLDTTPSSSAFVMRLTSTSKYGLIVRSGDDDTVALTARGESATGPSREREWRAAVLEAALEPDIFKGFYEAYDGEKLPSDDMARNMLQRDLAVDAKLTSECLGVIKANGLYAGILGEVGGSLYVSASGAHANDAADPDTGGPTGPLVKEPMEQPTVADVERPREPARSAPPGDILIGHVGAVDIVRDIEAVLRSFGVGHRVLELGDGATFDEDALEVTGACHAAVALYAGPSPPPLDATTERRAREDAVHLIGGATALFGKRTLLVRERGLERLRQESVIETVQFRREASAEMALRLLQKLHAMRIISVGI